MRERLPMSNCSTATKNLNSEERQSIGARASSTEVETPKTTKTAKKSHNSGQTSRSTTKEFEFKRETFLSMERFRESESQRKEEEHKLEMEERKLWMRCIQEESDKRKRCMDEQNEIMKRILCLYEYKLKNNK